MSWPMTVFTFLNAWFITLFFVVPFWTRPSLKAEKNEYAGAPQTIRWKKLLIFNTGVAFTITVLLAWFVSSGLVPVRDW